MAFTLKTSWLPAKLRNVLTFQVIMFIVTFMLYAAVHAARKTISNVGKPLKEVGYTKVFFGYMNAAFMLSYSLGMVFTGTLGDRFRPTMVLLIACIGVCVISVVFAFLVADYITSNYWPLYVFMWVVNGLLQSCVWPVEVKLVSNWFSKGHSGAIFGIWSANSSVGNILGIGLTAMCFSIWGETHVGVKWSFIIVSIVLLGVVSLVAIMPVTHTEAGLEETEGASTAKNLEDDIPASVEDTEGTERQQVSMWTAWKVPGVIRYGLCYACLKSVNYTIFYCLTTFLQDLGYETNVAYNITMLNDVGWIFGGLICGLGSDKMGYRAPFVGLFILLSIIPTALIYPFVENVYVTGALVTLNGFFAGGSGNVVSSACCADLGSAENIKKVTNGKAGGKDTDNLIGQVSGIVDGIGAFGAAICVLAMTYLSEQYVEAVFYTLAGMLVLALVLISDLVYRETKTWLGNRPKMNPSKFSPVKPAMDDEGVVKME